MPCRPSRLLLPAALLIAACRGDAPWDLPDWRPEQPPQRIVAGSILATEVLLEIAPRQRLAAVHELAADPHFSLVADTVGDLPLCGATPERLLAARPDLVIVDAFTRAETLALLRGAGVPVVRTGDPANFADIAANVRRIGRVCHLEAEAEALVARMERDLESVRTAAPEFADWRVLCLDGALHSYGAGSLPDAVLTTAGARDLAAEQGVGAFRRLDAESVLAWRPDAIVVTVPADAARSPGEWLRQHPGLRLLPCVQQDRIVAIPGPLLSTTSHLLVGAAQHLQATLRRWGRP